MCSCRVHLAGFHVFVIPQHPCGCRDFSGSLGYLSQFVCGASYPSQVIILWFFRFSVACSVWHPDVLAPRTGAARPTIIYSMSVKRTTALQDLLKLKLSTRCHRNLAMTVYICLNAFALALLTLYKSTPNDQPCPGSVPFTVVVKLFQVATLSPIRLVGITVRISQQKSVSLDKSRTIDVPGICGLHSTTFLLLSSNKQYKYPMPMVSASASPARDVVSRIATVLLYYTLMREV